MSTLFQQLNVIVKVSKPEIKEKVTRLVKENGGNVIENEEELVDKGAELFYVLDTFEGPIFEEVKKQKKYIIGTQCVYDSIHLNKPLPKSENPIFSRALEGIKLTSSKELKQKISLLVQYMNGVFQSDVESDTNYLIATHSSSHKYQRAIKKGILVLHPSWLMNCWHERCMVETPSYILKPFAGCIISVTGLGTGMRNMIQQLVQIYGGQFSPNLNKRCTHLIANSPAGVKYKYARSWGIPIITIDWLFDSLKMNACANPDNYRLPPAPLSLSSMMFSSNIEHSGKRPFDSISTTSPSLLASTSSASKNFVFPRKGLGLKSSDVSVDYYSQHVFDDLEKMIDLIDNITERIVNVDNCCELFEKSSMPGKENKHLRNTCRALILDNFDSLQNSPTYTRLSEALKKEIEDEVNGSSSLERTKRRRIETKQPNPSKLDEPITENTTSTQSTEQSEITPNNDQ